MRRDSICVRHREIEVVCDGADENEALAEAVQLIESGLGE